MLDNYKFLTTFSVPQGLQNELSNREPDLRLLLDKGQRMVDQASPLSDISDISDKMESMRTGWRKLKDKVADRKSKLKAANKHAEKFQGDMDTMLAWLGLEEEKLAKAGPMGLDKETLTRQVKDAQVQPHSITLTKVILLIFL